MKSSMFTALQMNVLTCTIAIIVSVHTWEFPVTAKYEYTDWPIGIGSGANWIKAPIRVYFTALFPIAKVSIVIYFND